MHGFGVGEGFTLLLVLGVALVLFGLPIAIAVILLRATLTREGPPNAMHRALTVLFGLSLVSAFMSCCMPAVLLAGAFSDVAAVAAPEKTSVLSVGIGRAVGVGRVAYLLSWLLSVVGGVVVFVDAYRRRKAAQGT